MNILNPMKRLSRGLARLVAAFVFLSAAAQADDRAISLIVPYPAGGGSDSVARVVGRLLQPILNQAIVVENIPGAGSRIAHQALMRSKPDGLRLMLTTSDMTINQALRAVPPWKVEDDFTHIALVGTSPLVYMVSTKHPPRTIGEFVDYAGKKSREGRSLNYGSGGAGSILHLPTLELASRFKLDMTHVPYRGAAPLIQDLTAGEIDFGVVNPVNATAREDKVRPLAITGLQRHPLLPHVPTMAEAGIPDVSTVAYAEIIGPANMPPQLVARLVAALQNVTATEEFKKSMTTAGAVPGWLAGPALVDYIQADLKKWRDLGRTTGIALTD